MPRLSDCWGNELRNVAATALISGFRKMHVRLCVIFLGCTTVVCVLLFEQTQICVCVNFEELLTCLTGPRAGTASSPNRNV